MATYWIYSSNELVDLVLTAKLLSNTEVTLEDRDLTYDPEVLWRSEDSCIISEYNGKALSVSEDGSIRKRSRLVLTLKELAPRWRYDRNTSVISCEQYVGALTVMQDENKQPYPALVPRGNSLRQNFDVSIAKPSANI
ncbi:3322_t:CDS:2 [Ambispora leptoticha]|uniref:3322_t:CDS:1 n=1 Tax=Ambispora leptoticha TaxID=144679 RepID=A0A9N9I5C8_9GLOM|nr:3322_t:CDS:2 [Ambispora leptoticha]